MFLN
jgi:hypothetical protein